MDKQLAQEYYDWLDDTKEDLLDSINQVIDKKSLEKETLDIMKDLIRTIKIQPRE